jgi:hypothetical protein
MWLLDLEPAQAVTGAPEAVAAFGRYITGRAGPAHKRLGEEVHDRTDRLRV